MKLVSAKIGGIKTYADTEEIKFFVGDEKVTLLIGPNGGGKSNAIDAIQAFFNQTILCRTYRLEMLTPKRLPNGQIDVYKYRLQNENFDVGQALAVREGYEATIELDLSFNEIDQKNVEDFLSSSNVIIGFVDSFFDKEDSQSSNAVSELIGGINNLIDLVSQGARLPERLTFSLANYPQMATSQEPSIKLAVNWLAWNETFLRISLLYNAETDNDMILVNPLFTYIGPRRNPIAQSQFITLSQNTYSDITTRTGIGGQEAQHTGWQQLATRLALEVVRRRHNLQTAHELFGAFGYCFKTTTLTRDMPNTQISIEIMGNESRPHSFSSGEAELLSILSIISFREIHNGVVIIDEPELHLHPSMQKKLFNILLKISSTTESQLVAVTHSPYLINEKSIRYCTTIKKDDLGCSKVNKVSEAYFSMRQTKEILNLIEPLDLGDVLFSRKAMIVEGVCDRIIYSHLIRLLFPTYDLDQNVIAAGGGVGTALGIKKLLDALGIDCVVLMDQDAATDYDGSLNALWLKERDKDTLTCRATTDAEIKKAKKLLRQAIKDAAENNIFILPGGAIEHYFPVQGQSQKYDTARANKLVLSGSMKKSKIPAQIKTILLKVVQA